MSIFHGQSGFKLERLLVACDGQPESDTAIRFARLLALRYGAKPEIVGVFTPRIPVPPLADRSPDHECERADRPAAADLRERVHAQARRLRIHWPIHFRVGHAPWIIAELARSRRADLIVLGNSVRGEPGSRPHSRHTAQQLALASDVPIVAIPQDHCDSLPRVVVVVLSESPASARAARIARVLLAPGGTVHLVGSSQGSGPLSSIDRFDADLVAVPMPGDSFAVRSLMGGGVANLLDHARCGVLVVPAEQTSTPTDRAASQRARPPKAEMSLALRRR